MTDPQTPTPRVDAAFRCHLNTAEVISADFARTLERDLTACQSALAEARRDAERYRWLRDHTCNSLSIERDEQAASYVTAKQWVEECFPESFSNVDPDELQRIKDTGVLWSLQIYPDTPIGFNMWHGATLDFVVDAALAETREVKE